MSILVIARMNKLIFSYVCFSTSHTYHTVHMYNIKPDRKVSKNESVKTNILYLEEINPFQSRLQVCTTIFTVLEAPLKFKFLGFPTAAPLHYIQLSLHHQSFCLSMFFEVMKQKKVLWNHIW